MLNKKVTVLMPVYNGEDYVKSAIDSVLSQTYTDFDLLVINDGSTDRSQSLILEYEDERIKYVLNEENIGLIKTLNKGLKMITGTYIIRMDADDICLPERFEKQVSFMDEHPVIAVSGTSVTKFNESGTLKQEYVKTGPIDLKTQLLFGSPLRHPSVIIRNDVIREGNYYYDELLDTVEDYGLWQEISQHNLLANIQEPLLRYRINEMGITKQADKKVAFRDNQHKVIYERVFNQLGVATTAEELQVYRELVVGRLKLNHTELLLLKSLLGKLILAVTQSDYNLSLVEEYLKRFMTINCLNSRKSLGEWKRLYRRYFKGIFIWTMMDDLKYTIKKNRGSKT